jgi:DNA-3-methyladenine glycosylase I
VDKVACYGERRIASLLADPGIVRNRLKINATIRNAQAFIEIQNEWKTFSRYLWDFVEGRPIQNRWVSSSQMPTRTELSDRVSRDLQQRGMTFVGSTIIYSYLQAVGLVNDHIVSCHRYAQLVSE